MNAKLLATFAAGSAVTFLTMLLVAAAPEAEKPTGWGPYQLERVSESAFLVIDTRDGHVWWKALNGHWSDQGTPPAK